MRRFYLPHEQNKLRMRRFYPRLFIWMDRVEDDPLLTFVQKKRKIVKDQESGV